MDNMNKTTTKGDHMHKIDLIANLLNVIDELADRSEADIDPAVRNAYEFAQSLVAHVLDDCTEEEIDDAAQASVEAAWELRTESSNR